MKITIISGTNRPGSNTRKVANFCAESLKEWAPTVKVSLLDLCDLPIEIFHPSTYATKPTSFEPFKKNILETDGILSVLPEYNGSAPGIFKYFVDLLPFPQSLKQKPATFIGIGAGRFGAVRACEHMQQVFEYRNAFIYPERVFIPFVDKEIEESGKPKDQKTLELLEAQLKGFVEFTRKLKAN